MKSSFSQYPLLFLRLTLFCWGFTLLEITQSAPTLAQLDCGADAIAGEVCIPGTPPQPTPPPNPTEPPEPPEPTEKPETPEKPEPTPEPEPEAHGAPGSLEALAVFHSWTGFADLLLEPLPQKVPLDRTDLIVPGPETSDDPPYRFAATPGAYYSERDDWRLQVFGNTGGGELIPSNADYGSTTITGSYNVGVKVDLAVNDNTRLGVFSRFAGQDFSVGGGHGFQRSAASSQQIGAGLFSQLERTDWFLRAAIGWDALDGTTPLQVRHDPEHGDFRASINRSGHAFHGALQGGLRWALNSTHLLEPSLKLTGSWADVSGGSRHGYRISGSETGIGGLDLGVTWRAPMRDGTGLFTPSLRVAWLHRSVLSDTPDSDIQVSGGRDIRLDTPDIQTDGLGLQGQLAYTFKDNTDVVLHGSAAFYGSQPLWTAGARLQVRF